MEVTKLLLIAIGMYDKKTGVYETSHGQSQLFCRTYMSLQNNAFPFPLRYSWLEFLPQNRLSPGFRLFSVGPSKSRGRNLSRPQSAVSQAYTGAGTIRMCRGAKTYLSIQTSNFILAITALPLYCE